MLRCNYHTHTVLCDGSDTPEDVVLEAIAKGFRHLGFSGHMDPDIHMDWPAYVAEVSRLRRKYADRLDILMGVELDNMYDPACCPGAEYVIGSTHFLDVDSPVPMSVDSSLDTMRDLCRNYFGGDYYALSRAYFELEAKVYDRLHCTWVGHFDLVTRFNDEAHFLDESDPRYTGPALEAMEYLAGEGVPFEINCGAVNRGRKAELYPRHELLRALHDFGGQIFINADAHQKELLDGGFDVAVRKAIDCGFTHVNYLAHDAAGGVQVRQVALDGLY
ncbi:histidinol-phosphatase HisJ family protein [Parafannyhessea umbonata]|uniref:Histidinol-phosphatase n=1 Tax=Parafannyhessea umbonata TaxID=604330 RepID=A0A1G6HU99_9ACTN|nr:histidinol-phosphatase HisJ family protein [Parafannyhessea umbonata]SDB97046.1 histidinol-phosphatase (PHP family) [Parafannyhessea umbonata]